MDEKKKIILTVLAGPVILFYLSVHFFMPMLVNNSKLFQEYKKLSSEFRALMKFTDEKYSSLSEKVDNAANVLAMCLPSEGEFKFIEYITRSPVASDDIIFKSIEQMPEIKKQDYSLLPVKIIMEAPLEQFVVYLNQLYENRLLLAIKDININLLQKEKKILNINMSLFGVRDRYKGQPLSAYLEKKIESLDLSGVDSLISSIEVKRRYKVDFPLRLEDVVFQKYSIQEKAIPKESIAKPQESVFTLKGILQTAEKKAALINGLVIMEGQEVKGIKVIKIDKDEVIIEYLGKRIILKMGENNAINKYL